MKPQKSFFTGAQEFRTNHEELILRGIRDEEKIKFLSSENTWLREQLEAIKRQQYGKKSERWESKEQGCLFNEAEVESQKEELEDEANTKIQVPGHERVRGHRKPLPENLPREVVKIELPIEEQVARDGTPLKVIGWEVSEKFKYEPAKMTVIQYQRAKYGVDSGDYEKTAPPVPSIIAKGIATPELLAAIAVGKYADGLPLYRMEEIFDRHGIELSRGTMARWMIQVATACAPVWGLLSDRLKASPYVACDETHTQVLKEKGRPAESKSWMWVRSTPYGKEKIVLFNYSPSRSGETARNLFADFKGYLQCDGLSSYDTLEKQPGITRIGCNMHARRRFESAKVTGAKAGKSLGEKGLEFYGKLYDLEEKIKSEEPAERYRLRLEHTLPIWNEMKAWVDEWEPKVPVKSKIGMAFSYFKSEYEYLIGYLKDGRLEPDNGFTERTIRKFAIGRNNWLFSDSEEGAGASSVLYSLVITAKMNGVNPYKALVTLFTELPKAKTREEFGRLADLLLKSEATSA